MPASAFGPANTRALPNWPVFSGVRLASTVVTTASPRPARPANIPTFAIATEVGAGSGFTCALLNGNGALTDEAKPVAVTGLTGVTTISANENHTCALSPAGLSCWGTDYAGQLGDVPVIETGTPAAVQGL